MKTRFSIKVPATTANIGSGFDCAGIALKLYNDFIFDFSREKGLEFFGVDGRFATEDNLVYQTFSEILIAKDIAIPTDFYLEMVTNIPVARGLGSSSTCIIAGIMAANIYGELNLKLADMLQMATKIEGHPDNIAPAILGGMVLAVALDEEVLYKKIIPANMYTFIVIIEDNEVSTADARAVMPKMISYDDAVFNISRAGLLLEAFQTGDAKLLKVVTQDRIHQAHRAKLIKCYEGLQPVLASKLFTTSWVSGSGSTQVALSLKQQACEAVAAILAVSPELCVLALDVEVDMPLIEML
ncbi:homoserine kinase [Erysipelotrichaceae bacterium]|nr:homoserine kinase [Erysipelotrichaceae bacterium]